LVLLLTSLLLVGCYGVEPLVKIGFVAPFAGRHRDVGYDAIYAARLAVRQVNRAGGIGSYRLELVALDDGGEPALARQSAATLIVDPGVVAVVGHWLPETTREARPLYEAEGVPLLAAGPDPFTAIEPDALPAQFLTAYATVTPFDEVAGPYAGPAYDALQMLFRALEVAESRGKITRQSVAAALEGIQYEGLTGRSYRP
jgi:ABC-type branched-subunit amino acid transport system substrate-binding protein